MDNEEFQTSRDIFHAKDAAYSSSGIGIEKIACREVWNSCHEVIPLTHSDIVPVSDPHIISEHTIIRIAINTQKSLMS